MEEDDGPGADFGGHPVGNGGGVVVLPVQAVPVGSGCKGLGKTNRGDLMGTIVYYLRFLRAVWKHISQALLQMV